MSGGCDEKKDGVWVGEREGIRERTGRSGIILQGVDDELNVKGEEKASTLLKKNRIKQTGKKEE